MSAEPEIIALANEDERDFLAAFVDTTEEHEAARVDSRLDWLLEKLAKRKAEIAKNDAVADWRKLQIEDWRQGENAKIERATSWLEYQVRELVPPDGDSFKEAYGAKSRNLPFGTVGYKKYPDKIQILDEARALVWAKTHGLEIKRVESETVSKATLKKALDTFDDPDGFEIVRGLDEFYVKTDDLQKGH